MRRGAAENACEDVKAAIPSASTVNCVMQFTGGPGLQQALRLEDWDPPGVLRELQESLDIFPQRHFLGMMGLAVCAFRTLLRSCSLVGIWTVCLRLNAIRLRCCSN